jgi:hypothetical protein
MHNNYDCFLQRVCQENLGINAPKLAIVSTNHVIPYLAHVLLVDVNMDIQASPVVQVCINDLS